MTKQFRITVKQVVIHDVFVKADSLDEAKDKALDNTDAWVEDTESTYTELGQDHWVLDEKKDWVGV